MQVTTAGRPPIEYGTHRARQMSSKSLDLVG